MKLTVLCWLKVGLIQIQYEVYHIPATHTLISGEILSDMSITFAILNLNDVCKRTWQTVYVSMHICVIEPFTVHFVVWQDSQCLLIRSSSILFVPTQQTFFSVSCCAQLFKIKEHFLTQEHVHTSKLVTFECYLISYCLEFVVKRLDSQF